MAASLRRFVEVSRRAEILALVNSARSDAEVAGLAAEQLCAAFEAEAAFVAATAQGLGSLEFLGQTGVRPEHCERLREDAELIRVLGSPRVQVRHGTDLLGLPARRLAVCSRPTRSGRHALIGVARYYDEPFEPFELALLEAVSDSVGHALERTWLADELTAQAARQSAVARAAKALNGSLVRDDVLAAVSSEVAEAFGADAVAVFFGEPGPEPELELVAGRGLPPGSVGLRGLPPRALGPRTTRAGHPLVHQPMDGAVPVGVPGVRKLRAGLATPLRRHGSVDGVLFVGWAGRRWISEPDVELLGAFAELAAIAARNAEEHAAVQRAATLDSLTGALNHGALQSRLREELDRAARTSRALAFVLLDLNDFKGVNDRFGHLTGDRLLRGVADALRAVVRSYDQVARFGGDEFCLLLPAADEATARRVVDRALTSLSELELPDGGRVGASAGLAHARPGEPADELVERADQALLEHKRARRRRGGDPDGARHADAPARVDEEETQRQRRLAATGRLGARLGRLLDERTIAETAIVELVGSLGYEHAVLARARADGGLRSIAAARSEPSLRGRRGPVVLARGDEGHDGDGGLAMPSPRDAGQLSDAAGLALAERRTVLASSAPGDTEATSDLAAPIYAGTALWGVLSMRASQPGAFDEDDAQVVRRVAEHLGAALRTAQLYRQLEETHLGTAEALAAALEAKDTYTADHARSIADQAVAVGQELGLEEDALRDIRYGAVFHDIGKIAVPDAILNKPGPLDAQEAALVRQHPIVGEQILAPVPFLAGVRRIVRHDHERWDGHGYPDGLADDAIPLGARIVLVVDAYHAMTSDRPYRPALDPAAARAELLAHAGTQFDPDVVGALLTVLDREGQTVPAPVRQPIR